METEKLDFVLYGARYFKLTLIGNRTIGYKFVPSSPIAKFVNALFVSMENEIESSVYINWCEQNKDGPFEVDLWNE